MKYAMLVLLLCSFAAAKDKDLSDFPQQFEVLNEDFGGKSCHFIVRRGGMFYTVENNNVSRISAIATVCGSPRLSAPLSSMNIGVTR